MLLTACRIIEPSQKDQIPIALIESGLDTVIWVDVKNEESRRRALGRRVDSDTEFHIDDNPPPITQPPLCERLMPVIEPERAEEVIPDKHLAFDILSKKLNTWFSRFGYEDDKVQLCQHIDGNSRKIEEVTSNIVDVLETTLKRKQEQRNEVREAFRKEIVD